MKFKNILKGMAGILVAGSLASCSSDYLDVAPITNITDADMAGSEEGVEAGYYGVCRSMYMQYSDMDGYMFFNGEGWIQMFYGDVMGQDYNSAMWQQQMGNINYNWGSMTLPNGWQSRIMWMYAYNLINQSNKILANIDNLIGDENNPENMNGNNVARMKASLLTLRAHAYVRLLQCYAPRWQDSNNGATKCLVLRLPNTPTTAPLSTMAEILDQVYSDLDNAIELYDKTSMKRSYIWEPDKTVAQGVYARAALIKEDWPKAEKMAHDARQSYPIMSIDEYMGGFAEANDEYMWTNALTDEFMYYWATGSVYGCNGAYATLWEYGAGAINIDLYRKMDSRDPRRMLFWTWDAARTVNRKISPADFYDAEICNPGTMNTNTIQGMKTALRTYGAMRVPNGDTEKYGLPYTVRVEGQDPSKVTIQIAFGAQYKFWGVDAFGTNQFPFMRASEMLLAEAEAAYHNNNATTAQNCLNELMANRYDGYTCTATGQALLDEIRLNRRIELWGEGHSWFDLKRWNLPMERRAWVEKDVNSGNVPAVNAMVMEPEQNNGWRYSLPRSESDYNHGVEN